MSIIVNRPSMDSFILSVPNTIVLCFGEMGKTAAQSSWTIKGVWIHKELDFACGFQLTQFEITLEKEDETPLAQIDHGKLNGSG